MDDGVANNGINNYKGVMLCSRPNEVMNAPTEKPFCGRVVIREQLGLVPVKQQRTVTFSPKKPKLEILDRHKKWLDNFKKDVEAKKSQIEENKRQEDERMQRIKQQGQMDRERSKKMKQQYNQTATNVLNILNDDEPIRITSNQLTPENLQRLNRINESQKSQASKEKIKQSPTKEQNKNFKKNKKNPKPLWAQTEEQIQMNEQEQVDELLDFFTTNHVEDYAQNDQVKDILSNLKQKIQKLKEEENWKENEMKKISQKKEEKLKLQQIRKDDEDDKVTNFSHQSESRSVASQKSQQKIQELKAKKKQQPDWDKNTVSQKSSISGIDERIAKNIADQVLRNYPNMRGVHSNFSIRKLLQAEAARVMNEPIARPVITTIVREKQRIDANNLPYLHRNPAI